MCCDLLTKSFNFTSSIARFLINNFSKLNSLNKNDESNSKILASSEKNMKIAFKVLNKLTANNKLFLIDTYIKQFIFYVVNKM